MENRWTSLSSRWPLLVKEALRWLRHVTREAQQQGGGIAEPEAANAQAAAACREALEEAVGCLDAQLLRAHTSLSYIQLYAI